MTVQWWVAWVMGMWLVTSPVVWAATDQPDDSALAAEVEALASAEPAPAVSVPPPIRSPQHPPQQPRVMEYYLAEGDILNISVWQWPDLEQRDVVVRPDGKISFPLVGDVQSAGITITQLDQTLTEALMRYIKEPYVSISITKFGGYKVIVLGEVRSPGVYTTTREASLLEVVSLAGGFTPGAKVKNIVLLRGPTDQPDVQLIDLYQTMRGQTPTLHANVPILAGDIIYVPRTVMTDVKEAFNAVVPAINAVFQTVVGYQDLTQEE